MYCNGAPRIHTASKRRGRASLKLGAKGLIPSHAATSSAPLASHTSTPTPNQLSPIILPFYPYLAAAVGSSFVLKHRLRTRKVQRLFNSGSQSHGNGTITKSHTHVSLYPAAQGDQAPRAKPAKPSVLASILELPAPPRDAIFSRCCGFTRAVGRIPMTSQIFGDTETTNIRSRPYQSQFRGRKTIKLSSNFSLPCYLSRNYYRFGRGVQVGSGTEKLKLDTDTTFTYLGLPTMPLCVSCTLRGRTIWARISRVRLVGSWSEAMGRLL